MEGANKRKHAQVLDVQNAVSRLVDRPKWQRVKDRGMWLSTWQPDNPLADLFLIHFGAYPTPEETWVDNREILKRAADATDQPLAVGEITSASLSGSCER
jgi:hypothetical protein